MSKKSNPRVAAIREMMAHAERMTGRKPNYAYFSDEYDHQVTGMIGSLVEAVSTPTLGNVLAHVASLSGLSKETANTLAPVIFRQINKSRKALGRATAPRTKK